MYFVKIDCYGVSTQTGSTKNTDRFYKECKKNLKLKFVLNTKPTHNCFLFSSQDRLKNFPCIGSNSVCFSDQIFRCNFSLRFSIGSLVVIGKTKELPDLNSSGS